LAALPAVLVDADDDREGFREAGFNPSAAPQVAMA